MTPTPPAQPSPLTREERDEIVKLVHSFRVSARDMAYWIERFEDTIKAVEAELNDANRQLEVLRPGGLYAWKSKYEEQSERLAAVEAELVELRQRDRVLSNQLEKRAGGRDELTQSLQARLEIVEAERDALRAENNELRGNLGDAFMEQRVLENQLYEAERDAIRKDLDR